MIKRKLFLASSAELVDDREKFEIFVCRKNKTLIDQDAFLELIVWEDFLDALSATRLQDEYNKQIKQCDAFIMLFWRKVGKYTEEEFDTAVGQFRATQKPFVFTYFKDVATESVEPSVSAFKQKLSALGHFYTRYENVDQLKFHFDQQLDKLAAKGFMELARPGVEDAAASYEAHLQLGAGGVYVRGDNRGNINTGTQTNINTGGGAYIAGSVTAGRDFIGRDRLQQGQSAGELETLFAQLLAGVVQHAPISAQPQAVVQVRELKAEVAKGKQADDSKIGTMVDGLVGLVPGAVTAVVSAFASPLLQAVAGPVTQFVLAKLKR